MTRADSAPADGEDRGEDRREDRREELAVAALTLVHERIGKALLVIITSSSEAAYERALSEVFACMVQAEPVLRQMLPGVWRTCQAAAAAVRPAKDGGNDLLVLRSELVEVQRALHHYLVDHDVPREVLALYETGHFQQRLLAPLADGTALPAALTPTERESLTKGPR